MYADDIGTLAFEDRKKPLQNDELKIPTDFIRAFQDKVAAKSQGGGGELMKQFKLFDEEGRGFGEFSTLILRTCLLACLRWFLHPYFIGLLLFLLLLGLLSRGTCCVWYTLLTSRLPCVWRLVA